MREAVWRTRKGWHQKRLLSQIERAHCPVQFRNLPYFAPGAPALSNAGGLLITKYADDIGSGRFPFLGYGTQHLGYEPQWNVDFISGYEWLPAYKNGYLTATPAGSDIKVPWELSRLQFLPVLGKAYRITKDEHYRADAKRLTSAWIMKNPVGVGVNWSIAMEAALRAMSLCFLLNLLSPIRTEEQNWLGVVTRCLWHHLLYIEAHLEFSHLIRSNHYLSNLIGLYCLSEFLDGSGMSARRNLYRQKVESEILRQTYEDGGDYEASTGYHVLVTQMFTSALLLMRAANVTPQPSFLERLQRMYSVIEHLASPGGQLPHVGDCDDGRVELLTDDLEQMLEFPVEQRNSLRVSNLLGFGKCLFGGSQGSLEDASWHALGDPGDNVVSSAATAEPRKSDIIVLPQSGMSVARAERAEVLFFAIPNGVCGKGSHNHNDKLSFVLRLDGEEVLCDSGTCTYTRDVKMRNRFRATSAHNTVMVDEQEQNIIDTSRTGLFSTGSEAEVHRIEDWSQNGEVFLRASHSGYERFGVTHIRTIRLSERKPVAVVEDQLGGSAAHRFEINFQLASGWKVSSVDKLPSEIRARVSGPRELEIRFQGAGNIQGQEEASLVSMTYGRSTTSSRLRFWGEATFPATLITTFSWEA